jgi:hypothetical protein
MLKNPAKKPAKKYLNPIVFKGLSKCLLTWILRVLPNESILET